jgi:hypothetical protein
MYAATLPIVVSVFLFGALIHFAKRKRCYSHVENTISELGEVKAPDQRAVSLGVFLPIGIAMLIVAAWVNTRAPLSAWLALCIAIGYLSAAVFPCDVGSPLKGSWRQAFHNFGGGIQYVGGAIALYRMAGAPFEIAAMFVLAAAAAMSVPTLASSRGLIQRLAEIALFLGLSASLVFRVAPA